MWCSKEPPEAVEHANYRESVPFRSMVLCRQTPLCFASRVPPFDFSCLQAALRGKCRCFACALGAVAISVHIEALHTSSIQYFVTVDNANDNAFRRYHMGRLLGSIGSMLPQWLDGTELARAARDIERMCWRELGYGKAPLFPGDVPPFLLHDESGNPTGQPLQELMPPTELAARLAALEPSAPPGPSVLESNFQTLARLLNLTPAESEWLLWSYCFTRFASPTIALRSEDHAWSVLAEVLAVFPDEIRGHKPPHRLQVTGLLKAPQLPANRGLELSDWLRCTPHFMEAVEAHHPSEAALWNALTAPAAR